MKNMKSKSRVVAALVAGLVLASCGGSGSSSDDSSGSAPVSLVKNAALTNPGWTVPCSFGGACRLGDRGPGGGVVFYRGEKTLNAVPGVSDGGVYMEFLNWSVASGHNNIGDANQQWGCYETLLDGADGLAVGTGAQNTKEIVAACADTKIPAHTALNSEMGGQKDWFSPSYAELDLFCQYAHGQTPTISAEGKLLCNKTAQLISPLPARTTKWGDFWSSSEVNPKRAKSMSMTEKDFDSFKDWDMQVAMIRSFGEVTPGPIPENPVYKCKHGGPCVTGDEGPGGGTVFWVGSTAVNNYTGGYDGGKYMEFLDVEPNTTYKFKCVTHVNDTSKSIGSGAKNTELYAKACTESDSPVNLARNATNGGKTDWFIPSFEELNAICRWSRGLDTASTAQCEGKKAVTKKGSDFTKAIWSSTQYSKRSMYGVAFADGREILRDKTEYRYNYYIVRAFG